MPIFGSDLPGFGKDPQYREAQREIEGVVLGERWNRQRKKQSRNSLGASIEDARSTIDDWLGIGVTFNMRNFPMSLCSNPGGDGQMVYWTAMLTIERDA